MHHSRGLRDLLSREERSASEIDQIISALQSNSIDESLFTAADLKMLKYSSKLTLTPQQMNEDDVGGLRAVGFDDRSIHDIACIVGYFAFVNRVADGLGVELEPTQTD